jgi:hypothetical protein
VKGEEVLKGYSTAVQDHRLVYRFDRDKPEFRKIESPAPIEGYSYLDTRGGQKTCGVAVLSNKELLFYDLNGVLFSRIPLKDLVHEKLHSIVMLEKCEKIFIKTFEDIVGGWYFLREYDLQGHLLRKIAYGGDFSDSTPIGEMKD